MNGLIEDLEYWLTGKEYNHGKVKRLFIVNLAYMICMMLFTGFIYYECWKAEFDIFSNTSPSFWNFISPSNFTKQLELLYDNYTQIGTFNITMIVVFSLCSIVLGGFVSFISVKYLLDYYYEIDNVKIVIISLLSIFLIDLLLIWIIGKYLALFVLVIILITILTILKASSD